MNLLLLSHPNLLKIGSLCMPDPRIRLFPPLAAGCPQRPAAYCRIPETDKLTTVITAAINATANTFELCDPNLITVLEVKLLIINYERLFHS